MALPAQSAIPKLKSVLPAGSAFLTAWGNFLGDSWLRKPVSRQQQLQQSFFPSTPQTQTRTSQPENLPKLNNDILPTLRFVREAAKRIPNTRVGSQVESSGLPAFRATSYMTGRVSAR
jgi:hypothetical protein